MHSHSSCERPDQHSGCTATPFQTSFAVSEGRRKSMTFLPVLFVLRQRRQSVVPRCYSVRRPSQLPKRALQGTRNTTASVHSQTASNLHPSRCHFRGPL